MAKRFYNYGELITYANPEMGKLKQFKPAGTLGSHCLLIGFYNTKLHIVSMDGQNLYLDQDQTIGYNCGRLWIAKEPTSPLDFWRKENFAKLKLEEDYPKYTSKEFTNYSPNSRTFYAEDWIAIYDLKGNLLKSSDSIEDSDSRPYGCGGDVTSYNTKIIQGLEWAFYIQKIEGWKGVDQQRSTKTIVLNKNLGNKAFSAANRWAETQLLK